MATKTKEAKTFKGEVKHNPAVRGVYYVDDDEGRLLFEELDNWLTSHPEFIGRKITITVEVWNKDATDLTPVETMFSFDQIEGIWKMCMAMEHGDNKGWTKDTLNAMCPSGAFFLGADWREYRQGIITIAHGHWSLCRRPTNWDKIFQARFPTAYERITGEEENARKLANLVSIDKLSRSK